MNDWFESKRYQDLVRVTRAMDYPAQARIIDEAIAETTGPEQAFWLRLRQSRQLQASWERKQRASELWAELPPLLAAASDDPETRKEVAHRALWNYIQTQRRDLWAEYFPAVRPYLRLTVGDFTWPYKIGVLRLHQRRWHCALRAFTKTLGLFNQFPAAVQQAQRGRLVFLHSLRASAAAACGHLALAASDIDTACVIDAEFEKAYLAPYALALARAEVALVRGDLGAAQAALQEGMARAAICQHKPQPNDLIQFDLAAARISRAQGNETSFRHFADRALATATEWDLQFSRAAVEAVLAGAER